MKKLYKQLMKTSALICLLILGTGNAWGEVTWNCGNKMTSGKEISATNNRYLIANKEYTKGIKIKTTSSNITYATNSNPKGILFTPSHLLKLTPFGDTGEALLLRFTKPTNINGPITINITGQDGMNESYEINTDAGNTSDTGEMIVFEITADKTYTVSSTNNFYFNAATLIETSDIIDLDEEATSATNQTEIAKGKKYVRLKRTLTAGIWNTFCLPITLPSSEIQPQLRCSAYKMDSYSDNDNTITFTQILASNGKPWLTANTPCLIKPSKTLVNPIFASTTASKYVNPTATSGDLSFVGVYGAENIYTTGDENSTKFYLNNDGYLVYPTSDTGNNGKIKGFRAYFEWTGGSSGVKDMTFVFDDSETTGIKTIEHDIFGENGRVYSIDGRYMGDSTDNLSRGIYIQNGRKFVVK